jgi:hypothetical protein
MPGGKIAIFGLGLIGRRMPIISEHLNFINTPKKLQIISLPKENNVLTDIINQRNFEITQDLRLIFQKDLKSLVNIYKQVQRKYYPEKDVILKRKKEGVQNAVNR